MLIKNCETTLHPVITSPEVIADLLYQPLICAVSQSNVQDCAELLKDRFVVQISIEQWNKINLTAGNLEVVYPIIRFACANKRQDLLSIFIGSRSSCLGDFLLDAVKRSDPKACIEIVKKQNLRSISIEKWREISSHIAHIGIFYLFCDLACKKDRQDLLSILIESCSQLLGQILLDAVKKSYLETSLTILRDPHAGSISIEQWCEILLQVKDLEIFYHILRCAAKNNRRDVLSLFIGSRTATEYEELCLSYPHDLPTLAAILSFVTEEHLPDHKALALLYWADRGNLAMVAANIDEKTTVECYEMASYLLDTCDLGSTKGEFLAILNDLSSKWQNRGHAENVLYRISPLSF